MKKLLALILALMMMFSIAACNQKPPSNDKDDDTKTSDKNVDEEAPEDEDEDEDEDEKESSKDDDDDDKKTSKDDDDEDDYEYDRKPVTSGDLDEDEDEKETSKDDEDEKKPSSKDDDLEDFLQGTWVSEQNLASLFNMGMSMSAGDTGFDDALALKELNVAISIEFDGDEAIMKMEVLDYDDIKEELSKKFKDLFEQIGQNATDDQIEDIIDNAFKSMETTNKGDFELDGDMIVIDGEEFGEVEIKNDDKIVITVAGESAEAFESFGIDTDWTFERD